MQRRQYKDTQKCSKFLQIPTNQDKSDKSELQFDSQQDFQLAAILAVVDVFGGQPLRQGDFEISIGIEGASIVLTEKRTVN